MIEKIFSPKSELWLTRNWLIKKIDKEEKITEIAYIIN